MQQRTFRPPKPMTWAGWDLTRSRSSLTWPSHWRKMIFKVREHHDVLNDKSTIRVWPRNPEYDKEECVVGSKFADLDTGKEYKVDPETNKIITLPDPCLDPIDFDTYEDVDAWARAAARLER